MNSILKHTFKSILKNKIQAGIIVLTVVLVTSFLFVAFSLSDVFYIISASEQTRLASDSDMLLGSINPHGRSFDKADVEAVLEPGDIEYVDYYLRTKTIVKTDRMSKIVTIDATDLSVYLKNHSLNIISEYESYISDYQAFDYGKNPDLIEEGTEASQSPESDDEQNPEDIEQEILLPAVIGKNFADTAGLKVGDTIEVYLGSLYRTMTVVCIAADQGIFASATGFNILTEFLTLSDGSEVNTVYIKFSSSGLFSKYKAVFATHLPNIPTTNAKTNEASRDSTKNSTMLMTVAVIFITAAMMLILLTSYLIIARHRMNDMIIFKSCGATPRQVMLIMLLEVFVYGFFGAAIGLFVGRVFMHVATGFLLPSGSFLIKYQFWKYFLSFIIAFSVCVLSCILPCIKTARKTIRELTSSPQKIAKNGKPIGAVVSLLVVVGCLIAKGYLSGVYTIALTVVFIAAIACFISLSLPIAVRFFSYIFSKISRTGAIFLSAKSAKRSKGIHAVTVLLISIIVFSFAIFEVVDLVKISISPYLTRYSADYVAIYSGHQARGMQELIKEELLKDDDIEGVGYFCNSAFWSPDNSDNTIGIQGVSDEQTLLNCSKNGLSNGTLERWRQTDNAIVLPQEMALRCNLKTGDTLRLRSADSSNRGLELEFVLVGIDYTTTEWDYVGFVKFSIVERYSYSSTFLIEANPLAENKDGMFLRVRDRAENLTIVVNGRPRIIRNMYALEYEEWAYAGERNVSGMAALLTFMQTLLFIISFLGLINIAIVSVYDRRQEFILYKLSGMSRGDYLKFSFGEGLLMAVLGGVYGLFLCFAVNLLLPALAFIIQKHISFGFFPIFALGIIGAFSAAFIAIWLLIAVFNRKINISRINEKFNY